MRRWHEDVAVMTRRLHEERQLFGDDAFRYELGRMRKHRVGGCGRAHCGLCHPSKRWHRQGDRAQDERAWRRDHELT
jgi:hypothetical protein